MEFGELKAEAYSSLSIWEKIELNTEIVHILSSVERLVDPPLYYAKELDEAIQVRR